MALKNRVINPPAATPIKDKPTRHSQRFKIKQIVLDAREQGMTFQPEQAALPEPGFLFPPIAQRRKVSPRSVETVFNASLIGVIVVVIGHVARTNHRKIDIANCLCTAQNTPEQPDLINEGKSVRVGVNDLRTTEQLLQYHIRPGDRRPGLGLRSRHMVACIGPFQARLINKSTIEALFEHNRTIAAICEHALQIDEIAGIFCPSIAAERLLEYRWPVTSDGIVAIKR